MSESVKSKDHSIKQIFDSHKRFIGCLMRIEGSDIIIGINNEGTFVGRYDGENTYLLPSNEFFAKNNALYEVILKKFVEK